MNSFFKIFLLPILLSGHVWADDSCSNAVIVNINVDYGKGDGALPGPKKDLENFKKIYGTGPNVHYLTIKSGMSKAQVMSQIQKMVGSSSNVILNYSGHGFKTNSLAPISDADLAAKAKDSIKTKPEYPNYASEGLMSSSEHEFQMVTPDCFKCHSESEIDCEYSCSKKSYPGLSEPEQSVFSHNCKAAICNNPQMNPQLANCYSKSCIGADDLSKILQGRHVTGMIDACFSGAMKLKGADYSFITSVGPDRTAPDSPDGGVLSRAALAACQTNTPGSDLTSWQLRRQVRQQFTGINPDVPAHTPEQRGKGCIIPADKCKASNHGGPSTKSSVQTTQ